MSLTFLLEAGAHDPIEPELVKLQMAGHTGTYSGIRTSGGVLRVTMVYRHAAGPVRSQRTELKTDAATPIHFHKTLPDFSVRLLRQLYLLEWNGLHRLLQSARDDLAAIAEEDRRLLLASVGIAEVELQMTQQLLVRASKNARLIIYLSIWLLNFQGLLRDTGSVGDKGVVCRVVLRGKDEAGGIVILTATGASSTMVTSQLAPQIVTFKGVDGLGPVSAAVGTVDDLRAWCRYEKRDEGEVGEILGTVQSSRIDVQSIVSGGRTPSLISALTIESEGVLEDVGGMLRVHQLPVGEEK